MIELKPGRLSKKGKAAPGVERLDCPDRDGPHWLTNTPAGVTRCIGCRRTWAELDAEARAV